MKRHQIIAKIKAKEARIKKLDLEIQELRKLNCLLSDKKQQFIEQNEEVLIFGRPKKYETKLIGRVHWKQHFKDEDTEQVITIDRKSVVRVNGEWI